MSLWTIKGSAVNTDTSVDNVPCTFMLPSLIKKNNLKVGTLQHILIQMLIRIKYANKVVHMLGETVSEVWWGAGEMYIKWQTLKNNLYIYI